MKELKTAIVISGMHRSGTSSFAGVVAKLGATMPSGPLLAAKPDNPNGFFESEKINVLNDRILAVSGTSWSDWRAVNNDWQNNPKYPEFLEAASRVIADEYGSSRFIFLKDPRFSKILPFWILALANSGFKTCHIIPVRHPEEVAASLAKLHTLPRTVAKLTWVRHLLDAELYSRGQPRIFIFWDDLLDDWERSAGEMANRFNITWPSLTDQVRTEIEQFLGQDLRHHRESADRDADISLGNDYLDKAYVALRLFSQDPDSATAAATFEAIRADFLRTERIYGPAFAELDALLRRVETDRDQRIQLLETDRDQPIQLLEIERHRSTELAADLARTKSTLDSTSIDRNAAMHRNIELGAQLDQARSRLDASTRECSALGKSLEEKSAQALDLEQRLTTEAHRLRLAHNRLDEWRKLSIFRKIACVVTNDDRYLNLNFIDAQIDLENLKLSDELTDTTAAAASLGLRDILQLNGIQFLVGSYGRLLRRQPDESGISHYLPRLLDGTPKIRILTDIAASGEAREKAAHLTGLRWAGFLLRLSSVPLIGAIVRLLARVEGNSAVDRRLRAIEQALHMKIQQPALARSWSNRSI
jgi:hypothetical protein